MSNKIGRNDPCPCGSGKKNKKCCIISENPRLQNSNVDNEIPTEVLEKFAEHNRKLSLWEEHYGKVRPTIHTDFEGHKFVAVGSELHYDKSWKTFIDFLKSYLISVFSSDWGNNELKKPFEERHQIVKWYDSMCHYQKKVQKDDNGLHGCIPNGAYAAFVNLAYDLYTIRHNSKLHVDMVKRLKMKEQFQGARYELFAAATCCRAGFDIDYEDEHDRSKKHPEFIAIHKELNQKVAVEAKSRHRAGVLDFPGEKNEEQLLKADVGRLLNQALQKPSEHPYVIFIDLNLPPSIGKTFEKTWFSELQKTIDRVAGDGKSTPDKFNAIIFTNHPHHYGGDWDPDPNNDTLCAFSMNPLIKSNHPHVINEIFEAALKYGNVPNFFDEV